MLKKLLSCLLFTSLIFWIDFLQGQTTVNFPLTEYTLSKTPEKDSYLYAGSTNTNYGTGNTMLIRDRNNSNRQRSVVEFDISSMMLQVQMN